MAVTVVDVEKTNGPAEDLPEMKVSVYRPVELLQLCRSNMEKSWILI
jgi:hypothetical protein